MPRRLETKLDGVVLLEPDVHGDERGFLVEIFSAPISAFLPGAPIETVTAERDGYHLRYGGYQIGRHHVWGATAMMLGRFGAYLGIGEFTTGTE